MEFESSVSEIYLPSGPGIVPEGFAKTPRGDSDVLSRDDLLMWLISLNDGRTSDVT